MSYKEIFNPDTGKIFDTFIPQGGGVPLAKGQLISADAFGKEMAVPAAGANNYVLTADSTTTTGLTWTPLSSSSLVTNDPLFDEVAGNQTTLSINFTSAKGEIPAGSGTAKVGALVPAPTTAGYVLTADTSSVPTGLAWKEPATPSGGGVVINRSNKATVQIAPPANNTTTMVCVAESTGATWDPYAGLLTPPYTISAVINTSSPYQFYAVQETLNGFKCGVIYDLQYGKLAVCTWGVPNTADACVNGFYYDSVSGTWTFYGSFSRVTWFGHLPTTASYYCIGKFSATIPFPGSLYYDLIPYSASVLGFSNVVGNNDDPSTTITQLLVDGTKLWFFGRFHQLIQTNGTQLIGYANAVYQTPSTDTWLTGPNAQLQNLVFGTTNQIVNAALIIGTTLYTGGDFIPQGSAINGFCITDLNTPYLRSTCTPPLATGDTVTSFAVSTVLPTQMILLGTLGLNNLALMTISTTALQYSTLPITTSGGLNCITNGVIEWSQGGGAVQTDFIMTYGTTGSEIVVYAIPTGTPAPPAPFVPVQVVTANKVYAPTTAYGIRINPFNNALSVGATTSIYDLDTTVHYTIAFTLAAPSKFINAGTQYSTATFANENSSQGFVSSQDATNWIVTGALITGLTLS